jgi:hypothetical protein
MVEVYLAYPNLVHPLTRYVGLQDMWVCDVFPEHDGRIDTLSSSWLNIFYCILQYLGLSL